MLEAKNLTKRYGSHVALQALDLTVAKGEVFCLLGANGAGKTTTIHLFMGFCQPSSGAAFVDGVQVDQHLRTVRHTLAYVPENVSLYPLLTGRENLEYFTRLAGVHRANTEDNDHWLDRVGLAVSARNERIAAYSKGMRQKVGLAIALAKGAGAFVLDEPLSGLDPGAANQFCRLLRSLAGEGVAILMATHDLFRSKQVADRIGIMKSGALMTTLNTASLGHDELERRYLECMKPTEPVGRPT